MEPKEKTELEGFTEETMKNLSDNKGDNDE